MIMIFVSATFFDLFTINTAEIRPSGFFLEVMFGWLWLFVLAGIMVIFPYNDKITSVTLLFGRENHILAKLCKDMNIKKPMLLLDSSYTYAYVSRTEVYGYIIAISNNVRDLSKEQLKSVFAHELAHLKHKDMVASSVWNFFSILFLLKMAVAVVIIASIFICSLIGLEYESLLGNFFFTLVYFLLFASCWLLTMFFKIRFSHAAEYLADATAARAVGSGKWLVEFLGINFRKESFFANILSSHPSDKQRIRVLDHFNPS
jgi:Zn-dependent protease with chaperone function